MMSELAIRVVIGVGSAAVAGAIGFVVGRRTSSDQESGPLDSDVEEALPHTGGEELNEEKERPEVNFTADAQVRWTATEARGVVLHELTTKLEWKAAYMRFTDGDGARVRLRMEEALTQLIQSCYGLSLNEAYVRYGDHSRDVMDSVLAEAKAEYEAAALAAA